MSARNTMSLSRAEIVEAISFIAERKIKSQTAFRDYIAICFLSILALRRNELVVLKWSDINFESSSANIFQKAAHISCYQLP